MAVDEPPAETITEKVPQSQSGWEMWVADEREMIQSDSPSTSQSQPSRSPPNPRFDPALVLHHPISNPNSLNSNLNLNLNLNLNPNLNLKPSTASPTTHPHPQHSSEGSLTGIGSLANYYKPQLPNPKIDHEPPPAALSSHSIILPIPHSDLKHSSHSPPLMANHLPNRLSLSNHGQSPLLSPKTVAPSPPPALPSNNDLLHNSPEPLNRPQNHPPLAMPVNPPQSTSPILPNSIQPSRPAHHSRSSAVSGLIPSPRVPSSGAIPAYASAYELFDRHVARVQPTRANQRSRPPSNTLGYTDIPPLPSQKRLYPQQPPAEVCVECMMRDRDMAGVDVVGPGVWARKSDADFEEAMAAEAAMDEEDLSEHGDTQNQHCRASLGRSSSGPDDPPEDPGRGSKSIPRAPSSGFQPHLSTGRASTSRESCELGNGSIGSAGTSHHRLRPQRKRLGRGDPLMAPSLKAWTQMNPPAASHRWRTLQLYLKEQRHYLELEHKAKLTTQLENQRAEQLIRNSVDTVGRANHLHGQLNSPSSVDYNFLNTVPVRGRAGGHRASTTTLLSSGMVVETLDISKDEKEAAKYRSNDGKHRQGASTRRVSSSSTTRIRGPLSPTPATLGLDTDRPYQSSTPQHTGLPGTPSTRAPSPSRYSVGSRRSAFADSIRPLSIWPRKRRSGSHSVLSFAPSGSMVEMHVGLSQDRHQHGFGYPGGHGSVRSMTMIDSNTPMIGAAGPHQMANLASLGATGDVSQAMTTSGAEQGGKKDKKKLKTTLKGLLVRLGLGRARACSIDRISAPSPIGPAMRGRAAHADDEPLVPPPSLSVLAREQQHQRRNRSALSLPLSTTRRFVFRPQSVSTATGGLESGLSSPVSQFMAPSSGSNAHLGVSGPGHRSPYMHAQDARFDSLAEELEVPVSGLGRSASGSGRTLSDRSGSGPGSGADQQQQQQPWSSGMTDKSGGSLRTVMSRSSQMLGKVPGLGGRGRRRSSASGTVPMSVVAKEANEVGSPVGEIGNGMMSHKKSATDQQEQRPEYLPLEKSRHGVSRSSDFLALRYLSVGNE